MCVSKINCVIVLAWLISCFINPHFIIICDVCDY